MNKIDNIMYYFDGNFAFALFISDFLYNEEKNSYYICKKEYINAAKVGCISNILLAIKEDLIEKKENVNYESRIFLDELESSVEILATKTENGYSINNYEFSDAPSLVAFLRNKIAHGDFTLDLSHTRIIINSAGKEIIININKLSSFINHAAINYSRRIQKKEYTRSFFITEKQDKKRTKPITGKDELKKFIKTYYEIRFDLKRIDGKDVEKYIANEFEYVINSFKKDLDLKKLMNFKNKIKSEYYFDWKRIKVDSKKLDAASESIINIIPTDINYKIQVYSISQELIGWLNPLYQKYNSILASSNNLLLLDAIYKIGTYNKKELLGYIVTNHGNLYFNQDYMASTSISLFNALFSYPFDDIYKNTHEFTNENNTGLDYSLLDLRYMKVEKHTIETPIKNELITSKLAKQKELQKLKEKYEELSISLKNVKDKNNSNAIKKINELIYNIDKCIDEKINEIKFIDKKLFEVLEYINNNKNYLKNKAIIEGIRNSIAHGNYRVELDGNMENSKMIFEDIYNNELTFKGTISIQEFLQMIIYNCTFINDFIKQKQKISFKVK